ncbi:MAG TPA: hypothetical protein VLK29_03400 [Luteimonas sp.]|nr:hypothetical protein [Luteimonas sp.]
MPASPLSCRLRRGLLCVALLSQPFVALAQDTSRASGHPDAAWSRMLDLAGSWRLAAAATPRQAAFRLVLAPVSRGSALEERYGDPAGDTTRTLFHRDGGRILATHYCAQGNQPRLAWNPAVSGGPDPIAFAFIDATNLPDPGASHLVRLSLALDAQGRLVRDEVYASRDGEERDVMVLVRAD